MQLVLHIKHHRNTVTKAFDRLQWSSVWQALAFTGCLPPLIAVIQNWYALTIAVRLKPDGRCAEEFYQWRGIRQCFGLSPLIFIHTLDFVMQVFQDTRELEGLPLTLLSWKTPKPTTQYMRSKSTSSEPSEVLCRDRSLGRFCFYCILQTCYSWSEATISHHMRMQTICKYTTNADLLMLFASRTACLHVWMMWHAEWLLTGCSSITPSPKYSGAHQQAVSTRYQVVPFVSEAQPYNLHPLYATLGSCWMPKSP